MYSVPKGMHIFMHFTLKNFISVFIIYSVATEISQIYKKKVVRKKNEYI
jgi:hypothetical protein